MNDLTLSLIECLKKETEHYRRLIQLAERQKDLLIAGKVESIPENTRLEEKEVFALGPLAAERAEFLAKLAPLFGVKNLNLEEAVKKCPSGEAEELQKAAADLVQTAKRLDQINRGNGKLLKNALSFANFTLRAVKSGGKTKTFVPDATLREENRPSFVNRVV
jgi:flagellar biosynthesis/type III secretory pathway chaperone